MGLLRNLLTVIGVIAVFGIFYVFIKPDWYDKLASNPASNTGVQKITPGVLHATYDCVKGTMEKDANDTYGVTLSEICDGQGQGIPSKNSSYLLIIDKSSNLMRYWKLSPNVKKVNLKNASSLSVQPKEQSASAYAPAYQLEIWVGQQMNLNLEFEVASPTK
ncbi:hypothetical protein KIH39_00925 [Telmatocola sphagniphila]|uniref:Uncharacterized protein n=1 Tax=Telmatocola sphagniphila TaxID=1123043 RepID=A0A8E6EVF0_9BACT|nr:hypothetical protein [Telmatocola sphagniphila]QVL32512.1 hypothetical protein KIH39_00925 [Telmatocola sphagniphila]